MKNKAHFKHLIDTPVFRELQEIADEMSLETYVVGGFVRDYLLDRREKQDIDIVVVGSGIALAKAIQKKLKITSQIQVFKTYGTAMLQWGDVTLEFVGARKESYTIESRNPVVSQGTLEEDQFRRDFTINAIAISLNKENFGTLLDPFTGLDDLEKRLLRTPRNPNTTYTDDPLRMLRAVRFATQLDFSIVPESLDAIRKNAERIKIISKERIVVEINEILETKSPSKGFILLEQTGLLPL